MDLTTSKNPNSMVLGSAKIEITKSPVLINTVKHDWTLKNLVDMSVARGVKISFSASQIDIKADNGTVPLKGQMDVKAKVEFSILERSIPTLELAMAGLVKVTPTYATDPNDKADTWFNNLKVEKLPTEAGYTGTEIGVGVPDVGAKIDMFYEGFNQTTNAKLNEGELTHAVPLGRYNGVTYVQFTGVSGVSEGDIVNIMTKLPRVVSYTLTKGAGGVAKSIAMKLTNKRKADDGRILSRTFEFPYGFYTGDDNITLKSKNDTDSVAEVPMSFEFSPHPDMLDDNELSEKSLYRETAEV